MNSHEVGYARADAAQGTHFLAAAPRTLQVRELAEHVASTDAPVLITGESGVGKEVLARFILAESGRARRSFVKINCAAVPHELLESELFFHERGAFTGAHQRKEGKFESAQGGTILVDEIGDMSLPLQAKLLHVLEDVSYSRVGGNQAVRMDARVLATTNKPLKQAIADAEFRRDLYFRLKVIQIDHPAEDLEGCADEILRVPTVDRLLQPIVDVIPLQLLAYYIAVRRGADVDQPRNLVKSVTME